MGLFHPYYVTNIELDVQHSLFYTFHRTDVRYIVTGFTDLLDDIHTMLQAGLFDESQEAMLRKCVMFYSAIGSEVCPEQFDLDKIATVSQQRVKTDLIPVLRKGTWFDVFQAQEKVRHYLGDVLVPEPDELAFWAAFRQKQYQPELLFRDETVLARISQHPMALWKCSEKQRNRPTQER